MIRQDLRQAIVTRAAEDGLFRKALLADPRTALAEMLGITIPAEVEIVVCEETPTRLCLVLPSGVAELSDEELAKVSGGERYAPARPLLGTLTRSVRS